MIKLPKLKKLEVILYRLELNGNKLVNNDDTLFDGSGNNYFMIFEDINDAILFVELSGLNRYRYDIRNDSGNLLKSIFPWDKNPFVKSLNNLFTCYKKKNILVGNDFQIGELSCDSYLHLIYKKTNYIYFEIRLSNDYLEVQIDRAPESFCSSSDESSMIQFNVFIKELLTSKVKVTYKGKYYTHICFLNKENLIIRNLIYKEGLTGFFYPIGKKETLLYQPVLNE